MEKKPNNSRGPEQRSIVIGPQITSLSKLEREAKNKSQRFKSNKIRTTKYNIFSFFPKALIFQFSRFANIYFLVTAIIQSIPYVSPLNPLTAILPLLFVLGISIIREGSEDYSRYRMDSQINKSKAVIYRNGKWDQAEWEEICVGDFIKLKSEERFPADIMVLSTSYTKESRGACFIETASLDGERNLKPRSAIPEIMDIVEKDGPTSLSGKITCSPPNANLHSFDGVVTVKTQSKEEQFSLTAKQLLLRGASLRNTEWVIGLVVYTGHDSKVMKNSENSRFKTSKMEILMNSLILRLLVLQALLYIASVVGFLSWNISIYDNYDKLWTYNYNIYVESFFMLLTYFILYNTMLPISLIVTLELTKVCQSYFISVDQDLFNQKKGKGCKVMTRSINEELGQVEYVFSDKTGTLTCNEMELKYLTVGNQTYSGTLSSKSENNNRFVNLNEYYSQELYTVLKKEEGKNLNISLPVSGSEAYSIKNEKQLVEEYMLLLATCHDCMPSISKEDSNIINYEGPSPDEICLVSAARQQDFVFLGNTSGSIVVEQFGDRKEHLKVCLFEFDNKRKMMSVIVEHKMEQGSVYKLYCKGADSAIIKRLSSGKQPYLDTVQSQTQECSKYGLRTLCMAMKVLSKSEVEAIKTKNLEISKSLDREKELEAYLDTVEKDLFLIGCSAVEDRLQDEVPQTIAKLLEASRFRVTRHQGVDAYRRQDGNC